MPAYRFNAVNQQGRTQKGLIEAENEKQARQQLRDKSLFPLSITLAKDQKISFFFFDLFKNKSLTSSVERERGLSSKELALITRQCATLLTAGLPLEEALQAVAEQMDKPRIQGLLFSVRSKVLEGHTLAAALSDHPNSFSPLFCATIAAGEKSGHLDKVLLRLADYTEQQWQLRQKLKTALIYPCMIVLVAIGIVGFLLEYVVPKMIAVYGRLDQALPLMTTVLIAISHFIKNYGLYVLIGLVVVIFAARWVLKKHIAYREKFHRVLLKFPIIGHALKTADTARFSRTLSILTSSGVPIVEAMGISSQLITLLPIQYAVQEAVNRVREGATIYLALKQTTYFSPMSIHMIASGEASGELESMLDRVANYQEADITRLIDVALALFEPAIILIMGVIVLFIVLAVLLPIFQLNEFTG